MKHFSAAKRVCAVITAMGFLALFFMCPLPAAAESESNAPVTDISDAAGFAAIASAPDGNYRLTADIDLGGSDWQPIPFRGKLDGNGHTLYNLHVTGVADDKLVTRDGNLKEYDTEFAGLFSTLENAEVDNLNIKGAFVDISMRSHCFAAILAGYCNNSTVKGCSVEGRVHMINCGINAGVAGIAGYGNGVFEECNAEVELVFEDRFTVGKCEQFLGGIMSCGIGSFMKCRVQIEGFVSCHGYAHNGGIIGMFYHCGMTYGNKEISNCYTKGQISFFEDNKDRRAYCMPIAGELLTPLKKFTHNYYSFKRNETKDYSKVLLPEKCEHPDYEETVTQPDCTTLGYTEHKCRGCDYSWIDSYTLPRHDPGEWVLVSDSDYEREGLKKQYCKKCGAQINEKTIPVKVQEEKPAPKKPVNKTVWAVAASAGILLIVETAAIVHSAKKKNPASDDEADDEDSEEKTEDTDDQ